MKIEVPNNAYFFLTLVFGIAGALIGGGYHASWSAAALGGGIGLIAIPAIILFFLLFG